MENAFSQLLQAITSQGETDFSKALQVTGLSDMNRNVLGNKSGIGQRNLMFNEFMKNLLAEKAKLGLAEAQSKQDIANQERQIQVNKESQMTAQSFQKQMQEIQNAFNIEQANTEWSRRLQLYEKQKKDQENASSDALWQKVLGFGVNAGLGALTGGLGLIPGVSAGVGAVLGLSGASNVLGQSLVKPSQMFTPEMMYRLIFGMNGLQTKQLPYNSDYGNS